ncbi:MAG: M48 family metalloprotease [Chitinophagales bacterium]|nr:M48 family metalloprotease [Chitinophagales bacterium]MDW8419329.1 M48 family metalloprotease [Chitinophagales bacterium]
MKKLLFALFLTAAASGLFTISACKKGVNFFTIEDDKAFGAQLEAEIAANPAQFPILNPTQYASSYQYLENMKQQIIASGKLQYANEFAWKLYIINDDTTLNAFCTPGGYIYIYTGLIKYLDNASSLAGVLGHEMAHADRRHSTQQLTKQYGFSILMDVLLGKNQNMLTQIAAGLTMLAFSRAHETDADMHSVYYLCGTQYRADGAADFFQKIINSGAQQPPQFLSTHPNPDNRVQNIQSKKQELSCTGNPSTQIEITDYAAFKASLP